jgi:short-subunit dehydrogenase
LALSYGTTKFAVVGLSRSLRAEARLYGVRVSVLCPGVIRTPILTGGRHGRFTKKVPDDVMLKMWQGLRPMDADVFASQVVQQVARRRAIIVVPRWWQLVWWMNRLFPTRVDALAYRAYMQSKTQIEAASTAK